MKWGMARTGLAAALLLSLASAALAETYPSRPVRLIVPFPPGGSNDVVARLLAGELSEHLGQQVFVDNRSGAGGVIGTEAAANAAPDGYTLLIVSIAHAVNPALYKLNYDPVRSFAPVTILASGPNVLAVNPHLPVTSLQELIALAKAKPGAVEYASAGIGSFQHLGGELFKLQAGVDMLHVPYKGGGPALTDVVSGHVNVIFSSLIQTLPLVQAGELRALATGAARRSPVLPDVPTIAEAGAPGYVAENWWGILVPAGTSATIVDKLREDIQGSLKSERLQQQFAREGASTLEMSSAEFGHHIETEIAKWGRVVKTEMPAAR
jgi:tripartite-type tricarboxylate transporter receptor subunit TctC